MEWECVGLKWRTKHWRDDVSFVSAYRRLCETGWEEYIRAPAEVYETGGVCIMRRPKDEPGLPEWQRLYREQYGQDPPTCFILPTEDEPRKWTEAEIEEIARRATTLNPDKVSLGGLVVGEPNTLVMTTSGKRVPAYTLADRPTGHYADPAF